MNIYKRTLQDSGVDSNAMTVGQKLTYVVCTILDTLEDEGADTDPAAAQSVINRLVELGVDRESPAIRAMQFDLDDTIQRQRQR
jgi:hypothetical protein